MQNIYNFIFYSIFIIMEYVYNFNGRKATLNEFKDEIINDYVTTNKTKKQLKEVYPVSVVTLGKILKGIVKQYCECLKCGNKNPQGFYKDNKSLCKDCISLKNKTEYSNLSKSDKADKIDKQKKWITKNVIKVRVLAAKHRAKRKKIEFDIDEEYINNLLTQQNYRCAYSNVVLNMDSIGSDTNHINSDTLSIDRYDPTKGYTKDNVILVTAIVNTMKNDLSHTAFINTINLILKKYKK